MNLYILFIKWYLYYFTYDMNEFIYNLNQCIKWYLYDYTYNLKWGWGWVYMLFIKWYLFYFRHLWYVLMLFTI